MSWSRLQPVLVSEGAEELLALYEVTTSSGRDQLAYCREKLVLPRGQLDPAPLVSGDDLIRHGVLPGRSLGVLLSRLRDAQLEEEISTRAEALALVDRLLERGLAEPDQ